MSLAWCIKRTRRWCKYLWIVLCVAGVQCDGFQIQSAIEIDCGNQISLKKFKSPVQPGTGGLKTYCRVGVIPLPPVPWPAAGVATGVAGIAPAAAFPFPLIPFDCMTFTSFGGVNSPITPGNDNDWGDVKALACNAVDGWEFRDSIMSNQVEISSSDYAASLSRLNVRWWGFENVIFEGK